MIEEIIKTVIEMSLCGIAVYTGSAIYNWGYRTGVNSTEKKMCELERIIDAQKKKIGELYAYIGRDYCVNPFRGKNIEGPSFVSKKTVDSINEYIGIDKKHLKSKRKKIEGGNK